jgi:hypothetical protein
MYGVAVPESIAPALKRIVSLTPAQFDAIFEVLKGYSPTNPVIPTASGASEQDVKSIAAAVANLEYGRSTLNLDSEQFAFRVASSFASSPDSHVDQPQLRNRLVRLMSLTALGAPGRAASLGGEFERVYLDSRIVTDIRPVFPESVDEGPTMFVITQTLKIEYKEAEDHKSFFVSMDNVDIKRLKDACDRAIAKSEKLPPILPDQSWLGVGTSGSSQ